MNNTHNEHYRYGSASFADEHQIRNAGLLGQTGLPLGHWGNKLLRLNSDGARISVLGAGGGKTATLLSYLLILPNRMPMMVLDPRGELLAISVAAATRQAIHIFSWN